MATKSQNTKRRTKVAEIRTGAKSLNKGDQKKVKGGFRGGVNVGSGVFVAAGDVTGDNVSKPTSIQDGTSNTILRKEP